MKQFVWVLALSSFILGSAIQASPTLTLQEKNTVISWCTNEYAHASGEVKAFLKVLHELIYELSGLIEQSFDRSASNPALMNQYHAECMMQMNRLANQCQMRVAHLVGNKKIKRFFDNKMQKIKSIPLIGRLHDLAAEMETLAATSNRDRLLQIHNDLRQLREDLKEIGTYL